MSKHHAKLSSSATLPIPGQSSRNVTLIDPVPAETGHRRMIDHLDIRIDPNGQWFYHGSLIQRKELVCLFSTALTRDDNGGYWLVTPSEMGQISVEDAPFIAVEMFCAGRGRGQTISFQTNVEEIVTVDAHHPLYNENSPFSGTLTPYVQLPRRLSAKLSRSVYYELMELCVQETDSDNDSFGVWSAGVFFRLGSMEDVS